MYRDDYGELITSLAIKNDRRICLLVLDGLGDCANGKRGTGLQIAATPNLDRLAGEGACGLLTPVATAVTPGSGPGHLALFGYDPLVYTVGRGVLSALGLEFPLGPRDVAARLNFCTLNAAGEVTDRRAGRISDDENRRVLAKLREALKPPAGVEVFLETESEHRALLVLRGDDLDDDVGDTDPQREGRAPLDPAAAPHHESPTARMMADLLSQVREALADEERANMVLSRGAAKYPDWPRFPERFRLNPAAVAGYPMYRGVARLVGMETVSAPQTASEVTAAAAAALATHDFVFAHFKYTDKAGEDGDLDAKVAHIEEMDAALPALLEARPDVLVITGDHSTPPSMSAHSWHPVPVLMLAPALRGGQPPRFDEITCRTGEIGTIPAKEMLPLAMAHAGKLEKFGA